MLRRRIARVPAPVAPKARGDRKDYRAPVFFDARRLWLLRQVAVVSAAAVTALCIRAFGFEAYTIPSGSMLETLLIGDHLFVDKYVYGPRLPFTTLRAPGTRAPQRGEVVVFTVAHEGAQVYPADERPSLPTLDFVKRIVGVPGDSISFDRGRVEVNGKVVEATPLDREFRDERGRSLLASQVHLGGHRFHVLDDPARDDVFVGALTVPPGRYFMLGDNRDHSLDSRVWGTVRQVDIKGPARWVYWSWDFNGSWLELLDPWLWWELLRERTRWERIGRSVP